MLERFVTEIAAPVPRDYEHLHRRIHTVDAHLLPCTNDDRAQVTVTQVVRVHRVSGRLDQCVDVVAQRHPVDAARVLEAPHVIVGAEDGGAVRRLVAANALEDARCVVDGVTHHVDGRVVPRYELTVAPNPGGAPGRDFCHRFPGALRSCIPRKIAGWAEAAPERWHGADWSPSG